MKLLIVWGLISLVLILNGCSGILKPNGIKSFIPGVYSRYYTDEYGERYDTIAIRETGTAYEVTKRSKLLKTIDGQQPEPHYMVIHWTGIYDDGKKWLLLDLVGKAISFDAAKKELSIGGKPYKKL